MTVVMQHWYDNLEVSEEGFSVTLNFGDAPEPLYIPYDAIKTFVDPSVEFGLRFETHGDEDEEADNTAPTLSPSAAKPKSNGDKPEEAAPKDAEIVSLDSFRK
jgi:hypothetical protein